jgi:hypothetical protein
VPLKTYDESIAILRRALEAVRPGHTEKLEGFRSLDRLTRAVEKQRQPLAEFSAAIAHERSISDSLDGRTAFDRGSKSERKTKGTQPRQFSLF